MFVDHFVAIFSATISFAGLMLVVLQLRAATRQRESESLVTIYDINRQLISLGFSHPHLFKIMDDGADDGSCTERRYLQLWLNQFALIHLFLTRTVFDRELKESLERDLADFLTISPRRDLRATDSAHLAAFFEEFQHSRCLFGCFVRQSDKFHLQRLLLRRLNYFSLEIAPRVSNKTTAHPKTYYKKCRIKRTFQAFFA